jgi:hypothetical protein
MLTFCDIPKSIFNNQRRLIHYNYRSGQPSGLQEVEAFRISRQSAQERFKVVSPKHRSPLPPGDIILTLISVPGRFDPSAIVVGRNKSMKNLIDFIGNRACDLPDCIAMPQPTASPPPTQSDSHLIMCSIFLY